MLLKLITQTDSVDIEIILKILCFVGLANGFPLFPVTNSLCFGVMTGSSNG